MNARDAVSYDKSVARTVARRFHVESLIVEMYALQRVHMKMQIDFCVEAKIQNVQVSFECLGMFTGVSILPDMFVPSLFTEMINLTFILYGKFERMCNSLYVGFAVPRVGYFGAPPPETLGAVLEIKFPRTCVVFANIIRHGLPYKFGTKRSHIFK